MTRGSHAGQPPAHFVQCIAEIQAICQRYDILLLGSCIDEGIEGEIEIMEASAYDPTQRRFPADDVFNVVQRDHWNTFWMVQNIGPDRFSMRRAP